MQKPQAIIFDWDDTLVDTWPVVRRAVNIALVAMGAEAWSEEEAHHHIGPPAKELFTGLFGADRWEEADAHFLAAYQESIQDHIRVYDRAEEVLERCQGLGIYLAVVSAKRGPLLRQEAALTGLEAYFTRLIGTGDAAQDKPDVATVEMALAGSGIQASQDVWFIGDGKTDMIAAHNANCWPILVRTKPVAAEALAAHPPAKELPEVSGLMDLLKAA